MLFYKFTINLIIICNISLLLIETTQNNTRNNTIINNNHQNMNTINTKKNGSNGSQSCI